ncbi:MAG TPA: 4Fe-4S binding protein [Clostridia bacterium]|nr:4Fe-4S binding protein [Clostridia bacterium]
MKHLIYFSPCGGTKKYLEKLMASKEETKVRDLTYKAQERLSLSKEDLLIIAFPVYYGRVPLLFLERLKNLEGSKTPAIILAVYGNRAFDDSLLEIKDFLIKKGFIPYAGAGLIAKHSFGLIQTHRPHKKDLEEVNDFLIQAIKKKSRAKAYNFPGNFPYKERGSLSFFPSTTDDCILCKACLRACPAHAIDEKINTLSERCILCMACLDVCPMGARVLDQEFDDFIKAFSEKLKEPRKNEFFL